MKIIAKKNRLVWGMLVCIGLFSCEKEPEPQDPCGDNDWARVEKNGKEVCLGQVAVDYFHPNTSSAVVIMTAGNEVVGDKELNLEFSIPVEGVELNTAYPVKTGKIHGADPVTEGSITFLVFDPPSLGKAGCFAGRFQLRSASDPAAPTFVYTNGRFVFSKGTVYQSHQGNADTNGCNPFK